MALKPLPDMSNLVFFEAEDVEKFHELVTEIEKARIAVAEHEAALNRHKLAMEKKYRIRRNLDEWNIEGGFAILFPKPDIDESGRVKKPKASPEKNDKKAGS